MFRNKRVAGFSLVELAVVLTIVAIVFTGAMSGLGEYRAVAKQLESEQSLKNIKQQLLKFAMINKYLPCPGADGREQRTVNACTSAVGDVPYLDIGLKRDDTLDAYGNPVRYAINTQTTLAASICNINSSASYFCDFTPGSAVFDMTITPPTALTDGTGNYSVCNNTIANCAGAPLAANLDTSTAVVVLVAYNEDGAQTLANCAATAGPTENNCDTNDLFYHRATKSSVEGQFFDDVIETITGYEIKSEILSPIIVWNNTDRGIPPVTYEDYDLDVGDYVPLDDPDTSDVIVVNRNVADSLDLGQGNDYVLIGNDLSSGVEYDNKTDEILNTGSNAALDTGSGDDYVYIVNEANSNVTLGEGDDYFVLGQSLTETLTADAGNDQVWIQGDISAGSNLDLGIGDDVLWLGDSSDPSSGDINQFIDGGDGVDILVLENFASAEDFWASGQFINVSGFEYIIFADDGSGTRAHCEVGVSCP